MPAKVEADIQTYNSVLEGQADQVDVAALVQTRAELVEALATDADERAVEVTARQTCIAALAHDGAEADAAAVRTGTDAMRLAGRCRPRWG